MRVATVLRSGGEYTPEHVARLRRQVPADLEMVCLTDMNVDVEGVEDVGFRYGWPGWWAKMELFRPGWHEDLLFMDLDTTVVGDLSPLLAVSVGPLPIVLRDFYRDNGLQSSLMYLPYDASEQVWDYWLPQSSWLMRTVRQGDQGVLELTWGDGARLWQKAARGAVVSYKVHVQPATTVGPKVHVVCFHGKPRPWDVPEISRREH